MFKVFRQTHIQVVKIKAAALIFNLDFEAAPPQMLQAKVDQAITVILIAVNYRVIQQFPCHQQ